jgi:microcystin-dependent protein
MSEPFLSEIKIMSFGFPPKGWALCDGQLLPINQNQALFSLLGTTYGGDGRVNFGLPNLQGRTPMHMGSGHTLGERGGEQAHTLSISEIPTHVHTANGSASNTNLQAPPPNTVLGGAPIYNDTISNLTSLIPGTLTNVGGSQAHLNMQPFLTLSFCIALQGIFPSQT